MIKDLDHQAKAKETLRKLIYVDSEKEAPDRSKTNSFSDRFSLESTGTFDTRDKTHFTGKGQKGFFKDKEPSRLRRSKRPENQSRTKERARRKKSKLRERRSKYQETSTDSEYDKGSEDNCKDLNSPYKRSKPTPFTLRITCFKYHWRAKLPRNIRVYERNKDSEDHLSIFLAATEQQEWLTPSGSDLSFEEKWSQVWHRWSVPFREIKETLVRRPREGKKQEWTKGGGKKYGSVFTLSHKGYFYSTHKNSEGNIGHGRHKFPKTTTLDRNFKKAKPEQIM
uniref:Uncharacterized protein n=1 Tax=Tanacetum cinerariifolium TaxID=118510 RepID=A0A6L2NYH3_TANCI|nr:hypothetical protein [Tanacetum cinerariifolium]